MLSWFRQKSRVEGKPPQETFPRIGSIANPAILWDGHDLLLCYEIAPVNGGGNAILEFSDVLYFEQNSNNVEGLRNSKYPVRAWDFTEVLGSDRTERWRTLSPRFWTISFNDLMVEIVFSEVRKIAESREAVSPHIALLNFLGTQYEPAPEGR